MKLHDALYAEKLFASRRLDIDFIPHIGVGNSDNPLDCITMTQMWNAQDLAIEGRIQEIKVISYADDTVTTITQISL